MISEVTIETWNGETVHLELSSPQPEMFESESKSLVPGYTLRAPHHPDSFSASQAPYADFWWGAPSMYPKRVTI